MLKYTVVLVGGMFAFMALAPETEGRIFGDKTVVSKVELASTPVVTPMPAPVKPVEIAAAPVITPTVPIETAEEPRAYVAPVADVVQIGETEAPAAPIMQGVADQNVILAAVTINSKPAPRPDRSTFAVAETSESNAFYPIWFVTARRVNVRQGPSTDFEVLGSVVYGEAAEVVADSGGDWVKIRIEGDGVEGFIARRFMSEVEPQN